MCCGGKNSGRIEVFVLIAIAEFRDKYPEGDDVAFMVEQINFCSLPFFNVNLQSQQYTNQFYDGFCLWNTLGP